MRFVKLEGTSQSSTNWTSEYKLENKTVRQGEPIELSDEEIAKLTAVGAVFSGSSAAEKDEFEKNRPAEVLVGDDVAAGIQSLEVAGVDQPEPVRDEVESVDEAESVSKPKEQVQTGSKSNKQ